MSSRLVFGAVSIGLAYGLPRAGASANAMLDESVVKSLIDHALECGITTFDTAPAYGASEERLGRVLGARGNVWTKAIAGDPTTSLEGSLDRLRRSHVELLQWHNWTAALGRDEAWVSSWARLRGDARVARLGATTYGVADAVAAVRSGLFEVVQCEFNLLNQSVVRALDEIRHEQSVPVAIAVRSVYLQGALTDEGRDLPDLPTLRQGVDRARGAAASGGLTRFALRAALEHPAIAHVLVGIDEKNQIDEAVRVATGPSLDDRQRANIGGLDLAGDSACDPRLWPKSTK